MGGSGNSEYPGGGGCYCNLKNLVCKLFFFRLLLLNLLILTISTIEVFGRFIFENDTWDELLIAV